MLMVIPMMLEKAIPSCEETAIYLLEWMVPTQPKTMIQMENKFLVDMYIKVESMRLDWYSKPAHQKLIQADLYQGILDTLATGETRASEDGRRIVLPSTFPGGDRDVQARFLDAMTLVQSFGKPDYFVTVTCNPYWEEIIHELLPGQAPQDRPDIVARVYKAKHRDLEDFMIKKKHFGEVAAYAHVIEFQKRGMPHEHFFIDHEKW